MLNVENYLIDEKIYESNKSVLFKGMNTEKTQAVVLKTLSNNYPTPEESSRLQKEFELIQSLPTQSIANALDFVKSDNRPVLVMEYIEGESLKQVVEHNKISLLEFLSFAIQMVQLIEDVHSANIIHKDIILENFIYDEIKSKMRIIDFDISTKFFSESLETLNHNELEGNLRYISPEQTGRMNRSIDYRTDFYSLGVCFYKMITGQYPFETDDPLSLIHSHLAQTPISPNEIDTAIPPVISHMIMKLLEKSADNRYQSIKGVLHDLNVCKKQFETGRIEEFKIARQDFYNKFKISEKLYGRDVEISKLLQTYGQSASGRKKMILVTGPPGIGKTVLINEIHKPVIENKGYFCSGKFEQYQKNIPFSAIIQAFGMLIKQLLTEGEDAIVEWKNRILEKVGNNGQVIIEVIPEVELLIGKQPAVGQLPPTETQNRFNSVFQDFIEAFPGQGHPLVIFIDDLQWADRASLGLIQTMLTDKQSGFLLFVGSYRDNEVDNTHILTTTLNDIKNEGEEWENLNLSPLIKHNILEMVQDTLSNSVSDPAGMVDLIHKKTGGNPFFVKEFFKYLYEESLIRSVESKDNNLWQWDLGKINEINVTDNVIELMKKKIRNLDEEAFEILKTACCIGTKFPIEIILAYYNQTKYDTYKILQEAINIGIVIKIKDGLKFAHDKVTEAVYRLIPVEQLSGIHYKLGKALLQQVNDDRGKLDELIFSISEQLNKAKDQLTEQDKVQLRQINLEAGLKAKLSTAYEGARGFFKDAAELLPDDAWHTDYEETFTLYIEWAEAEDLSMNFENSEKIYSLLMKNSHRSLDTASVYQKLIASNSMQYKFDIALDTGIKGLYELGIEIPDTITEEIIGNEIAKSNKLLEGKDIAFLSNLPEMKDKKIIKAAEIINSCYGPAATSSPMLAPLLFSKGSNLYLEHGVTTFAPIAFSTSALLYNSLGQYETAKILSETSLKLVAERPFTKWTQASTRPCANWCGTHFYKHHKTIVQNYKDDIHNCYEIGNFEYIAYIHTGYHVLYLTSGIQIDRIITVLKEAGPLVEKLSYTNNIYNVMLQTFLNLRDEKENPTRLDGDVCDEIAAFDEFQENNPFGLFVGYTMKFLLSYLFEKDDMMENLEKGLEFLTPSAEGLPPGPLLRFFQALALLRRLPQMNDEDKNIHVSTIEQLLRQFKKMRDINPYMYHHKYLLLKAEYNRTMGGPVDKIGLLYDEAIEIASKNELPNDQALINEHAGAYYLGLGMKKVAEVYLTGAYYYYSTWGAHAKALELNNKYQTFNLAGKVKREQGFTVSSSTVASVEGLDLMSILKASHTISIEIKFDELVRKMMQIVIENAGAEKGYFLMPDSQGNWCIEAEGVIADQKFNILNSIPLWNDTDQLLPMSVIQLVARTKQLLVLKNATTEGQFTQDPYILKNKQKSILCIPILQQTRFIGIVYLENNLMPDAFTPDRLKTLQMLSSQTAISLENAILYANLEEKVQHRTGELKAAHEKIVMLEKEAIEKQMAGGFAHEMRNALVGSKLVIEKALGYDRSKPHVSLMLENSRLLREAFLYLKERLTESDMNQVLAVMKKIFRNEEQLDDILGVTYKSVSRGLSITQQIMDYSRLGHETIDDNPVNIDELILNFIEENHQPFTDQGITLKHDLNTGYSHVNGREDHFTSIFSNLIFNARDALLDDSLPNTLPRKIVITSTQQNNYHEVSIEDNGTGIASENIPRIFDAFFSTKPESGTGLGLSVVKKLISLYKGDIKVESKIGQGSIFRVKLLRSTPNK